MFYELGRVVVRLNELPVRLPPWLPGPSADRHIADRFYRSSGGSR